MCVQDFRGYVQDYLPFLRTPPPPDPLSARPPKISTLELRTTAREPNVHIAGPPKISLFLRQPENSKCAHFMALALLAPPKFHAKTPKREKKKKERKLWREREKKRQILASCGGRSGGGGWRGVGRGAKYGNWLKTLKHQFWSIAQNGLWPNLVQPNLVLAKLATATHSRKPQVKRSSMKGKKWSH